MSNPDIAFLMEQTLGSVTHYLNLRKAEDTATGITPKWLPVEFRHGKVPWAVTGSLLARKALAHAGKVSGCFIHTTTIALLVVDSFRRMPTILSSDGTPANKREMRTTYGLDPESRLGRNAKAAVYRGVFGRAAGFVAWSNWTRASFIEDYGCREEDVEVIPPGIDLDQFTPGARDHEIPRILFVGGDFLRKGGDMLIDVFRKRLKGKAELVLVTQAEIPEEPGIFVHRNLGANSPKLRELYANCDVFTLPTRADCYSLVCMEALAAGMPLVATRVGGIPDMIREGETGHLVDRDDAGALGDALESLVSSREKRVEMGRKCRAEALRRFDARTNAHRLFEFVRQRCIR
ncbi:MAG TPA: glycosyltransferase family 4 protein [Myxococcales bacterium]|nr:glycosyltransferase family 4 protein [Myxococcales bacterium]